MIKAILWDNDGLLVDTERVYFEANRQVLLRAGVELTKQLFADVSLRQGLSLLPHFEFVITREDYAHGKPAPDGYLEGLRRLGVDPVECLAVEDSERGLVSAVAAGIRCIVVPNAESAGGDFSSALAVLPEVSRLPDFL